MTQFLLLAVGSTLSSAVIPVTFSPDSCPGGLPVIDAGYRFGQLHPHVVFWELMVKQLSPKTRSMMHH
jgi:hypothetical protein